MSKHVFILAGEVSGDMLAAQLVQDARTLDCGLTFSGIGGNLMQQAGVEILADIRNLAIVGAWEAVTHLPQLYRLMRKVKQYLRIHRPEMVILVDYPGFNLRVAQIAKQLGLTVLYYVSPQIWAWRAKRIQKIKRFVDHMMVLFAFEQKLYQHAQIPVTWVGHPLTTTIPKQQDIDKHTLYKQLNLTSSQKVVALLPGSRPNEIKRLLPEMVQAAHIIKQHLPDIHFILPIASSLDATIVSNYCPDYIQIIKPPLVNSLPICQAAIVTSGTATLELALCHTPMVIIYKTNWLTYWLAKRLIKIPYIGLCNIVANQLICKELIQKQAHSKAIAEEILLLLTDNSYHHKMATTLSNIRSQLGDRTAQRSTTKVIASLLTTEQLNQKLS